MKEHMKQEISKVKTKEDRHAKEVTNKQTNEKYTRKKDEKETLH